MEFTLSTAAILLLSNKLICCEVALAISVPGVPPSRTEMIRPPQILHASSMIIEGCQQTVLSYPQVRCRVVMKNICAKTKDYKLWHELPEYLIDNLFNANPVFAVTIA